MAWNNNIQSARWDGNTNINSSNFKIINVSSLYTNYISVGQINISSFTNLPSTLNASNWSYYPALSTVHGIKDPLTGANIIDIEDFNFIKANNIKAQAGTGLGGIIEADLLITAPDAELTNINTSKINCGSGLGEINLYGADLVAGDSALYVEGGTTLSGGGLVHGVTIGALTIGELVNAQRIDVFPTGIDIITPTYITIDSAAVANMAAGATCSIAAGGTLSLAGGAYIEYNSDEHLFVNTSAGNDFTDIYVGNIHGARPGHNPLRINENRGVEISNATQINLFENAFNPWNANTLYGVNSIIEHNNSQYVSLLSNRTVEPASTFTKWLSSVEYYPAQFVSTNFLYQCISTLSSPANRFPPNISSLSSVWKQMSSISTVAQVWAPYQFTGNSYIAGNKYSYARFGGLSTINISTNTLSAKEIKIRELNVSTLSSYSIDANNINLSSDAVNNASILFTNVVGNTFGAVGDGGNQLLIASLTDTIVDSANNCSIVASNILTVGASNATFLGTYETSVVGLGDVNIQSLSNVNVEANNVSIHANNRIDLSCNYIMSVSCATLLIDAPTSVYPGLQGNILVTSTLRGYFMSNLTIDANHTDVTNSLSAEGLSSITLSTNTIRTNDIYGTPDLTIYHDLHSLNGDIFFGSPTYTYKNYLVYYNTIFNNDITSLYGDISFGNIYNTGKNHLNYYNSIFNNTVTFNSNITANNVNIYVDNTTIEGTNTTYIKSGNLNVDYINSLSNSYVTYNTPLDLCNNAILNVSLIGTDTLIVAPTTNTGAGYINAGIVFNAISGDDYFWMLVRPELDLSGNEGIRIVQRTTIDGSQTNMGRLYDDTIYTPWAHCTGNLDMSGNSISNVDKMYYGSTRQPFIQYGDVSFSGGATQTISLPVHYANTNYVIQCTYAEDPGSNAKPIWADNKTTSNFTITGKTPHSAMWTTFGDV